MAALYEPSPQDTIPEGDSAQPASTTTGETAAGTDERWRSSASWWDYSDWRWSGWWGNRWDDQQWPWAPRHSYATVQTEGAQSGAPSNSSLRDGSGDRREQQHWRSDGSGTENAANEVASSSTGPSATMANDAAANSTTSANPVDPWWSWRNSSTSWSWSQSPGGPGGYNYKGDYSEPPPWPGWSYRRQWTQAIKRWDKQTDIPVFRRAEKVLRTLGWELQTEFEHLTEAQLASDQYLNLILQVMEMKAGVQEDAEKRVAFRSVLTDTSRKRDESLAQFAMRRLRRLHPSWELRTGTSCRT